MFFLKKGASKSKSFWGTLSATSFTIHILNSFQTLTGDLEWNRRLKELPDVGAVFLSNEGFSSLPFHLAGDNYKRPLEAERSSWRGGRPRKGLGPRARPGSRAGVRPFISLIHLPCLWHMFKQSHEEWMNLLPPFKLFCAPAVETCRYSGRNPC